MITKQPEIAERITVNLTRRSRAALALAQELSESSKTDIVNRALQVYSYLVHVEDKGGKVYAEEDGITAKVKIL